MFASSKVSQSMIDAVNKVLGENQSESNETVQPVVQQTQSGEVQQLDESVKETTPTGVKVFGSSYGNSAKAKQDQTKSSIDKLKGPKDKEMKEELKGNQDKIDANHNNKIDGQDFEMLRVKKDIAASRIEQQAKKKVKEGREFTEKLLETVRKSDVPAYLRKAKGDTPLTVADAKGPKKDTISAPENLAKARNEEVEQIEERDEGKHNNGKTTGFKVVAAKAAKEYGSKEAGNRVAGAIRKKVLAKEDVTEQELDEALNEVLSKDASAGDWIHDFIHSDNPKFSGKSKAERKKMALGAYYGKHNEGYEGSEADEKEDKKGEKETGMTDAQYEKSARDKKEDKAGKKKMKEEVDTGITTDTLTGREAGGKSNDFKSFKLKVKGDHTPEKDPSCENPEETSSRQTIKAKGGLGDKVDNLDAKYGKPNSFKEEVVEEGKGLSPGQDDAPFDGPYTKTPSNVKDKSGAVHTPMSRAKDLARQAFKKIKNETMMGKISN